MSQPAGGRRSGGPTRSTTNSSSPSACRAAATAVALLPLILLLLLLLLLPSTGGSTGTANDALACGNEKKIFWLQQHFYNILESGHGLHTIKTGLFLKKNKNNKIAEIISQQEQQNSPVAARSAVDRARQTA